MVGRHTTGEHLKRTTRSLKEEEDAAGGGLPPKGKEESEKVK